MKKSERNRQIDAVCEALDGLDVEDSAIIRPRPANDPVILSEAQLVAYAKRIEERKTLHKKLRVLAGEPIEED